MAFLYCDGHLPIYLFIYRSVTYHITFQHSDNLSVIVTASIWPYIYYIYLQYMTPVTSPLQVYLPCSTAGGL